MARIPPKRETRTRRGRNEGSVYQRKDGLWVGSVSLGVHSAKRIRRTVYGKTKVEAAEKLREVQSRYDAGRLPDAPSLTVEAWLERWLSLITGTVEPGTLSPYRTNCRKHIIPRIGGVKVAKLRAVDVESLFARLRKDGVSAALVRKIGTTLSVAMNHAVRSQLIPSNPCIGVKRPKAEPHKIEVLDAERVASLVDACRSMRLGPLYLLLLDSGMRPGEALALTWPDMDFTAKAVSITKALESTGRMKKPKTKQSRRTVALTPATVDALHQHRRTMLAEGRDVRKGPVFVSDRGGQILPNDITRGHLRPDMTAAGLAPCNAYALRHTCATLLLCAGVNPKIVSERLGHGSITMTLDTYSHVMPGMQSVATDALSKSLATNRLQSDVKQEGQNVNKTA